VLYPQNGARIVTIDSVTSLHPVNTLVNTSIPIHKRALIQILSHRSLPFFFRTDCQGRSNAFKLGGVQFLGLRYYYRSPEKIERYRPTQFGAVCYPHQTPTKKLRKKLGVQPIFFGGGGSGPPPPPTPPVVAPMLTPRISRTVYRYF